MNRPEPKPRADPDTAKPDPAERDDQDEPVLGPDFPLPPARDIGPSGTREIEDPPNAPPPPV